MTLLKRSVGERTQKRLQERERTYGRSQQEIKVLQEYTYAGTAATARFGLHETAELRP
jgi:hypothetical protein